MWQPPAVHALGADGALVFYGKLFEKAPDTQRLFKKDEMRVCVRDTGARAPCGRAMARECVATRRRPPPSRASLRRPPCHPAIAACLAACSQGGRLMAMLDKAVKGLSDVGALVPVLKDLGRRHVNVRGGGKPLCRPGGWGGARPPHAAASAPSRARPL